MVRETRPSRAHIPRKNNKEQVLTAKGFPENRAKQALKATKNAGLQPALDWLEKMQDKTDEQLEEEKPGMEIDEAPVDDHELKIGQVASLKCDDCGKLLRDHAAAEFHASKTEHQNFSESTEVLKPLTAEEKAAKLQELKEKLAVKRAAKAKEEEGNFKNANWAHVQNSCSTCK